MKARDREPHFLERLLRLLHLLEDNQIEIDQVLEEAWPVTGISEGERKEFEAAFDLIEFMEEIPGGFFIYYANEQERIIYANRGILRMFQCETMQEFRELTGNSFRGIVFPEDLDAVEKSIQKQIFMDWRSLDYVEYRIRRKDGSIRWVEDYGHYVHRELGEDIFYVFLGEASNEKSQQHMEQKQLLSEALEKANQAVNAKNTFLSHVSHDMRTPLNAIFGFTSLAKLHISQPEVAMGYLKQVEDASRQLLEMITHVLDVSSLSSAAGPEEKECNLLDTVREVCEFLFPQAQEKEISLTLDDSGVVHSDIYADQVKLKQLMLNLVNNAVTYTKPGGKVSVSVSEEGELPNNYGIYRLVVKDNGVGISQEFLEQVFEPFSREKNTTLTGIHGIGLGLTIVKNIVDMMNGAIEARSTVGEGTTFSVAFQFRVQPHTVVLGKEVSTQKAGRRILLVEDNELNREIETELLTNMGFAVETAENGKLALEKIEGSSTGDYDLILMDLQMPVMDGWKASAAIRRLQDPGLARIPIIALSANALASDLRKSKESGIDLHLPKPVDFPLLLEAIESLIGPQEV